MLAGAASSDAAMTWDGSRFAGEQAAIANTTVINVTSAFGGTGRYVRPTWLPKIAFTWFALIGALVVFGVGMFFRTPDRVLEAARRRAEQATTDDRPMALRGTDQTARPDEGLEVTRRH